MNDQFQIHSLYKPEGDQPEAIKKLSEGVLNGKTFQTLLGVTGSGKTFTIANLIETLQRPALVLAPNKTLAAQLYAEFRDFFPNNKVEYFVSYYDYYQPEAYVPGKDLYIEKDADINAEVERMRQSAVRSLIERRDVIVVASVSCIYGWQEPEDYIRNILRIQKNEPVQRKNLLRALINLQFERNDMNFVQGCVRVRGSCIDVFPAEAEDEAIRMEFFGDEIQRMAVFHPISGKILREIDRFTFFQAKQFVTTRQRLINALPDIRNELEERLSHFKSRQRWVEAERLEQRTRYDLELLETTGTCSGIENYSRHLAGRKAGGTPSTIIDYFGEDALTIIDESHIAIPQIKGMYHGDQSRKQNLVDFGFRLPSALDNRPLTWDEFLKKIQQVIFVSATPSSFEIQLSNGSYIEQVIRPTGLLDPELEVVSTENQMERLLNEITIRRDLKERVLVTTLTKRMAEDLSYYLLENGIKARYLHSDIDTIERVELLQALRRGDFDCLVGINLLREGLDLPEVSLVAIMDADKEGFLRSHVSLIQTIGRAARHVKGKVLLFADKTTDSMNKAIQETTRRRAKQLRYNEAHHIQPESIQKAVRQLLDVEGKKEEVKKAVFKGTYEEQRMQWQLIVRELEEQMHEKAEVLAYEEAAKIRDQIKKMKHHWEEWIITQEVTNNDRHSNAQKRSSKAKRNDAQARSKKRAS
jgi:excinuclease ABC subunit B